LSFCRECGQEYYTVFATKDEEGRRKFVPRGMDTLVDDDAEAGFLYLSEDAPWPTDADEIVKRLPLDWLEELPDGRVFR
jgi:hypothetical protein